MLVVLLPLALPVIAGTSIPVHLQVSAELKKRTKAGRGTAFKKAVAEAGWIVENMRRRNALSDVELTTRYPKRGADSAVADWDNMNAEDGDNPSLDQDDEELGYAERIRRNIEANNAKLSELLGISV